MLYRDQQDSSDLELPNNFSDNIHLAINIISLDAFVECNEHDYFAK